ncbi:carbamoyltransferase HypF [Kitasatospora sp. NPDC056783]|uniref:carbamoyltransferase HypF n=1 Tax=Kitasatospora sp. NPDC056783 TaxID=3345943 RepID=UPI00369D0B65
MTAGHPAIEHERRRVAVRGLVQGVGFRPFVHTLAGELGLAGSVTNTGEGVLVEIEGSRDALDAFCRRVAGDAPPLARVDAVEHTPLAVTGATGFRIVASRPGGPRTTLIPPDTAVCADCLAELADPADRRHRHPFISCVNCGPRHTIVTGLPYDRATTTMAGFPMCPDCAREYTDPADRRFHAQPIACHACGPTLGLTVPGRPALAGEDALAGARHLLAEGVVLAVKGIGGYHLACDARDPAAVALLRRRKRRGDKPFALMARDLATVEGLLPLPLPVPVRPALAVGGDLKNTFALARDGYAWLSGHIGDMDDLATLRAFDRAVEQLGTVSGVRPELLVADRHPGYRSLRHAERTAAGRPVRRVQHHHAHIAAVMAEHGLDGGRPVLGVAFDGTGYGEDGAIWGGEVLLADYDRFRRLAHLGYVALPGGDAAVERPYRTALAHLRAAGLPWTPGLPPVEACGEEELRLLGRQLERGLHCVPTSSMGRLFDAVSALAGVCGRAGYEAQAAIELEAAACEFGPAGGYRFGLSAGADGWIADPGPVLAAAVAEVAAGAPAGLIAARFHAAVADLVRRICAAVRDRHGTTVVALSGGVFANALLSSACARGLGEDGFTVLRHRRVPPNDGGLALGQLMVAARSSATREE